MSEKTLVNIFKVIAGFCATLILGLISVIVVQTVDISVSAHQAAVIGGSGAFASFLVGAFVAVLKSKPRHIEVHAHHEPEAPIMVEPLPYALFLSDTEKAQQDAAHHLRREMRINRRAYSDLTRVDRFELETDEHFRTKRYVEWSELVPSHTLPTMEELRPQYVSEPEPMPEPLSEEEWRRLMVQKGASRDGLVLVRDGMCLSREECERRLNPDALFTMGGFVA